MRVTKINSIFVFITPAIFFLLVFIPLSIAQEEAKPAGDEGKEIILQESPDIKTQPFKIKRLADHIKKDKRLEKLKVVAVSFLPRTKYGLVDWAEGVRAGVIAPLSSIDGRFIQEKTFDLKVIIKSKRRFMPNVLFPHKIHTYWLSCKICHPKIFKKKKGGNPKMTMWKIAKGKYCGRCHDRVAFPIRECYRCHMPRIPEHFPKIPKNKEVFTKSR